MNYTSTEIVEIAERLASYLPGSRIRRYSGSGKINASCPVCKEGKSGLRKKRFYIYQSRATRQWRCRCYNAGCPISGSSHDPLWVLSSLSGESKMSLLLEIVKNPLDRQAIQETGERVSMHLELPEGSVQLTPKFLAPLKGTRDWEMIRDICHYIDDRYIFDAPFVPPLYAVSPDEWLIKKNLHWMDRFIIPFRSIRKKLVYYQGRHVGDSDIKYYGSEQDGKRPFYGMDMLQAKQKVFITEGPIDSFFIPNCISIGSAMFTADEALEICNLVGVTLKDLIFIPDNPWIDDTGKESMLKAIDLGVSVHLWDRCDYKDINDVVIDNKDPLYFGNPDEWANIISGNSAKMQLKMKGLYLENKRNKYSFKEESSTDGKQGNPFRQKLNDRL